MLHLQFRRWLWSFDSQWLDYQVCLSTHAGHACPKKCRSTCFYLFLAEQLRDWVLIESFVHYRKRSFYGDLLTRPFDWSSTLRQIYQSRASFWYQTWPAFLLWFAQVRSHTRSCLYYTYSTLTTSNIWLHITYACTLEDYLFLHKSNEEPLEKKLMFLYFHFLEGANRARMTHLGNILWIITQQVVVEVYSLWGNDIESIESDQ